MPYVILVRCPFQGEVEFSRAYTMAQAERIIEQAGRQYGIPANHFTIKGV